MRAKGLHWIVGLSSRPGRVSRWRGLGLWALNLCLLASPCQAAAAPPPPVPQAAGDPASDGQLRLVLRPPVDARPLDLRGAQLRIDRGGARVLLLPAGKRPMLFSLSERRLRLGLSDALDLGLSAKTATADATVQLDLREPALALIARNRAGRGWRAELPAVPVAVTLSGDDRLVVVALRDGTVRWYAADTGRPLLSWAVDPVHQSWVLWTPAGYYDASAGGADRLGWELTSAAGTDFFRISLFRAQRLRPDLINRVLLVQDEDRALEQVNTEAGLRGPQLPIRQLLPPVVRLISPAPNTAVVQPRLLVRFAVRSPSGAPVQRVWLSMRGPGQQTRGAPLPVCRGAPEGAPTAELICAQQVDLPDEDVSLVLSAEGAYGPGEPALAPLRWAGAGRPGRKAEPDLYVLSVGVSRYRQEQLALRFPAKDARDLAGALKAQEGQRYRRVEARVLVDQQATRAAILEQLRRLSRDARPGDVVAIFLAGHGITDQARGTYAFYPQDVDPWQPETQLSGETLRAELARVTGRVVLFLDTCHAGQVDLSRLADDLASNASGVVVYASSSGGQASLESPRWNNGVFTKAVVEGLNGRADAANSGCITVSALEHYVARRVTELTAERQVPVSAKPSTMPDLLLATVPARKRVVRSGWFWGAMGVVAAGSLVGVAVGLASQRASLPGNLLIFHD